MRQTRSLEANRVHRQAELTLQKRSHLRRSTIFGASALVVYLGFQGASLAAGHCYRAESLKGPYGEPTSEPIEPVCLALERNLNEFCDQPPMVCELKIHPRHARELALPN